MTFSLFLSPSIAFSYLLIASISPCIYTIPFSIEWVLKLVLFVQYRLLYFLEHVQLPPWKNLFCNSRLCCYSLSHLYTSSRSCVVPCSIPSHISTCVIFTHSQTNHVIYHVISFDLSTSHVMSHMTDPDARLPMPAFPLWITDTITRLGRLPNWDIGLTSYLGNTPIWKLQNLNDWKTWWPDRDIRTSFPFQNDFNSQRPERKRLIQGLAYLLPTQNQQHLPWSFE